MRQHCAQCLTDVLANGRQTPSGETLCRSCYAALWGPSANEELRALVRLHTGRPRRNGQLAAQRV
jgi:recombinational DNA repair protein (RecF pathway)